MTANELRIGNLILVDGEITEITGIKKSTVFFSDGFQMFIAGGLEPIPLTEEWLRKFGFKNHIINEHTIYQNQWKKRFLTILWQKCGNYYNYSTGKFIIGSISFVHQLQNLYFALTGEELTIDNEETK